MKKFWILVIVLAAIACKEENATPDKPIDDDFDPTGATISKSGLFVNSAHTVTGTATLYEDAGKKTVLLDPFMSDNGPDLKVYLSKDANATEYINLGVMKSTSGKQSYEIPGNPDISGYKYVLIWCQQFSVLFGKAELK